MLNVIWLALIAVAVVLGGLRGKIDAVSSTAIDRANFSVTTALVLLAVMTLWLGLMRLADKAGLVHRLGLALKPILRFLFPDVPPDHPALGAIVLNVSANILGLNNAATPLGLRAMSELDKLNPRPGVATNAMCMLLAINTSSITLIPVTAISLLAAAKGKDPTIIVGTALAATAITQLCAITTCKLLEKTRWSRRQLEAAPTTRDLPTQAASPEGGDAAVKAASEDAALPWVPGSRWILAFFGSVFLGLTLAISFPLLAATTAGQFDRMGHFDGLLDAANTNTAFYAHDPEANRPWPIRIVSALSLLVLPWLILFFPLYAALRKIPVYEQFVEGGKEAAAVVLRILPYLVGMLVAVGMFSAAGGMDLIKWILSPLTNLVGFPPDLVPMAAIRPFSGTAALALLTDLVKNPAYGPNNLITLMAATFYGCSETTFYVIAVYFGSVGIRKSRHAILTGLIADTIQPISAVLICRAVLG